MRDTERESNKMNVDIKNKISLGISETNSLILKSMRTKTQICFLIKNHHPKDETLKSDIESIIW